MLLAAPAAANPVVVSFTGVLTSVSDPKGLLPSTLIPGTSIQGFFSYTSGASCQTVSPTTCEYLSLPSSLSLWLDTKAIASIGGQAYVFVEDGPLVDSFSASVVAPADPATGSAPVWLSGDLQLSDPGATALSSAGLPSTLDLGGFANHTFDAGGCYGGTCTGASLNQFQIAGTITSMQLCPEPGSGILLGLGLFAFGRLPSRSKQRSCFAAH
jgi:hypothetical protein